MTLNELKLVIAEMLDEAKKKTQKAEKLKKKGASIEAYGIYDEAFDFSAPLGALNLYRQQGAVNWGPQTSAGTHVDSTYQNPTQNTVNMKESEERALRALVREVIENGLVPAESAWAPMFESARETIFESSWDAASHLYEAWYDKFKKDEKASEKESAKDAGHEKTSYGAVQKHGRPPKKGKK